MHTVNLLLLVAACVCFILAVIGVEQRRVRLISLGLLFWVLVPTLAVLRT